MGKFAIVDKIIRSGLRPPKGYEFPSLSSVMSSLPDACPCWNSYHRVVLPNQSKPMERVHAVAIFAGTECT